MADGGIKHALDFLIKKSSSQGYVTLDDILACGDLFYLDVDDIERLTDIVLENNIIINNRPKVEIPIEKETDSKDYSSIYDAIVAAEPTLNNFIEYVRKIKPADKKEMVRIRYQILEGNKYARKRAVEGNLRIAIVLAYRESVAYNKNIADCISDACFALVSACNSYKPDEHQTFASYISIAIIDYFARTINVPLFVIPVNIVNLCRKLCKDFKYNTLERKQALLYVSEKYGLEENWSDIIYNILHLVLLGQSVLDHDFKSVYSESCFEIFNTEAENNIERDVVHNIVTQALDECLTDRERDVLEKRFGLKGEKSFSLEELAVAQNVTRERIRQIERKGLAKLKSKKGWFKEKLSLCFKESVPNFNDDTDSICES
ncbi:MAG: sigma-70 family RNA polymerase sigma factor [Fibrobacter sp.]|uniref:sigma-70 family RNA polymerase sigma factor n=1 Tax=Fibrobacter sp. TaxID=35828 RepID=UPI001B0E5C27|nr:sigma-70 family RNA polymerase sigma factor [Fibrobacter sp.]MBO7059473.1 sigma-70 family RNA polymerase sigma factor [Fibrobacter sp.]